MFQKIFGSLVFLMVMAFGSNPAFAQTCSVSSTFTTTGTSTGCFTRAGNSARVALTGTWVGTVQLQFSANNGASWRTQQTFTSNVAMDTPALQQNASWRWFASAYTSGTVTYTIYDVTVGFGRIKYSTVPIGSVAYSSFGFSTTGISTSGAMSDLYIQAPMNATGLAILVGGTGGTDTVTLSLYDPQCRLVASTAATTVSSTANAFQQIAFSTAPPTLQPGRYFVLVQISGTTATFRRVAANTFVDVATKSVTGLTYGTIPTTCNPPTSAESTGNPNNDRVGPVAYIY